MENLKKSVLILSILSLFFMSVRSVLTADEITKMMMGLRNACLSRIDVDEAMIDKIRVGQFPDDRNAKCYVNCILESMNVIRRGQFNYKLAVRQINVFMPAEMKDAYLNGIEMCKHSSDGIDDACDAAYSMLECFEKNNPMFMFP